MYLLCRESRKTITVALGGDGADELFAGYDPFRALRMAKAYAALVPRPVHTAIALLTGTLPVSHAKMSLDFRLKRTLRGLGYGPRLWNPVWLGSLTPEETGELLCEKTDIEEVYADAIDCWDRCRQPGIIEKTLQFFTRLYLQNDILAKIDRASMMHSLEVRTPFLDIDLVDFVRKIPSSYKYRNGSTKYLLKKALEPVLPRDILHRSKQGFSIPVGSWFKNGALTVTGRPPFAGMNQDFIEKQLSRHVANRSDNRAFLWNMWLLRGYMEGHGLQC